MSARGQRFHVDQRWSSASEGHRHRAVAARRSSPSAVARAMGWVSAGSSADSRVVVRVSAIEAGRSHGWPYPYREAQGLCCRRRACWLSGSV